MSQLTYRRDIDGLRAIAVAAVVLYHADVGFCSGGYVGVDIFFVISGFLIGSILFDEIDAGHFSALQFYKRRILRIAPALFAMLFAVALTAPFVFFPQEVREFTRTLIGVLTFSSNIYFAAHTNYFSDPYGTPLLHTWSLAVEEQFYVALPLLLLLLRRTGRSFRVVALILLFAASMIASIYLIRASPNLAFYSPIGRAWELLCGTLLIFLLPLSVRLSSTARECLLVLGLLLIVGSIHLYSAKTPFPGLYALAPCGGTALVILFGGAPRSLTGRALCWPPIVFVGLISYSLYLWHWPVIVLARILPLAFLPYHHRSQVILIVVLSTTLAVLSWYIVERPFRARSMRALSPAKVLPAFGAACVALLVVNAAVARIPAPFPSNALAMATYLNKVDSGGYRTGFCHIGDPYSFSDYHAQECLALDPTRPNVLIMGDSHAAAHYPGLHDVFTKVNFLQATAQGCLPIKDLDATKDCVALKKLIFYDFLPQHRLEGVLLIGRWGDAPAAPGSGPSNLDSTIRYLLALNQKPILVGPAPEYRNSLPRLLAFSLLNKDPLLPARYVRQDIFEVDDTLKSNARALGVPYLSVTELVCPNRECTEVSSFPAAPLLFDSNHFTLQGFRLFAETLLRDNPSAFLAPHNESQVEQ